MWTQHQPGKPAKQTCPDNYRQKAPFRAHENSKTGSPQHVRCVSSFKRPFRHLFVSGKRPEGAVRYQPRVRTLPMKLKLQASAICHPPFICHLPFAICHLRRGGVVRTSVTLVGQDITPSSLCLPIRARELTEFEQLCLCFPSTASFVTSFPISAIHSPVTSQEKAFHAFAQFAAKLKGDEKSEAQTFLFHLLEAFNHDANTLPEGASFEYRVRFPGNKT